MVNHFFTLLANLPGERVPQSQVLHDIYTPGYEPRGIPEYLIPVEHALFGDCSTEDERRQRAYALLYLVSGSDFSPSLTEFDSRMTYKWPAKFEARKIKGLGYVVAQLSDLPQSCLQVVIKEDDVKKYFYKAGTFVDKIAALVLSYVRRLSESRLPWRYPYGTTTTTTVAQINTVYVSGTGTEFDGSYDRVSDTRFEKGETHWIEKTGGQWEMSDGTTTLTAPDNGLDVPPSEFTGEKESPDEITAEGAGDEVFNTTYFSVAPSGGYIVASWAADVEGGTVRIDSFDAGGSYEHIMSSSTLGPNRYFDDSSFPYPPKTMAVSEGTPPAPTLEYDLTITASVAYSQE